jgi:hypothetical protein
MYEIGLFLGIAEVSEGNQLGYPIGERHALVVFSRQPEGSEPDWNLAKSHMQRCGWSDVEFEKASTLDPSALDLEPSARSSYDAAMINGSAIIVYSDPV